MTTKSFKPIGSIITAVALTGSLALPLATAYAQNRPEKVQEKLEEVRQKQQAVKERTEQIKESQASKSAELKLRQSDRQELIREKLAGVKLEACQQRQERISEHTTKIDARAEKLLQKMESIATKAEAFQDDKGIVADGLPDLKTEMENSRQAVVEALEAAGNTSAEFDCDSDGPKAQLQQFVGSMDEVRVSLKVYREAIHDYIQAIRQANGSHRDGEEEATSSATPTPESTVSAEEAE